jgi:hypothetical protein
LIPAQGIFGGALDLPASAFHQLSSGIYDRFLTEVSFTQSAGLERWIVKKIQILQVTAALLAAAALCSAGPIVYNVSHSVGTDTVSGTITTDGTIGVLSYADILGWNLLLSDGTTSITLTPSSDGGQMYSGIQGSDLAATSSTLSFNYSGADNGFVLFRGINSSTSATYLWCLQQTSVGCTTGPPEEIVILPGSGQKTVNRTGTLVFGTGAASASPEPSTFGLLFGGGIAIVGYRRRRA